MKEGYTYKSQVFIFVERALQLSLEKDVPSFQNGRCQINTRNRERPT